MNRKYYYINFINGKYRICKEYISYIQTDSPYEYYNIEFVNGIVRKNYQVFEKRRKARKQRDFENRYHRYMEV